MSVLFCCFQNPHAALTKGSAVCMHPLAAHETEAASQVELKKSAGPTLLQCKGQ